MPEHPLVIFVCTGNYYRSRFAEYLFTDLVEKQGLSWRADSTGLGIDWACKINPGPISRVTVESLASRGIAVTDPRMPRSMTTQDFETAARVILLDEPEHRPMMQEKFPDWAEHERVTYWKVIDVPPNEDFHPMDAIEPLVRELVEAIKTT
ncbi:MAG: low molecular weight phosphatase family protein [Phycisphaeraceae bacterium]